jgi:hypothetical protein
MKNIKGFVLGLVVGLALAVSSIAFAQGTTQGESANTKDSCCAQASCCSGDSCAMKHDPSKHGAMKHDAGAAMKHDQMSKEHAGKDGCCCCGGDSCQMKTDHAKPADKKG